jgi:hypothetical protein
MQLSLLDEAKINAFNNTEICAREILFAITDPEAIRKHAKKRQRAIDAINNWPKRD